MGNTDARLNLFSVFYFLQKVTQSVKNYKAMMWKLLPGMTLEKPELQGWYALFCSSIV